jgi:hypothetical protein
MPTQADVLKAMEIPHLSPDERSSDEGSIKLIDDELEEDDEIQDDLHIPVALEASASEVRGKEIDGKQTGSHFSGKVPSKAATEKATSRRLKQRPGSMRGTRTRGRRPIKDWGNASTPAISIKDIMGGERKATHVGLLGSSQGQGTVKAGTKLLNIRKMKGAKKERRKDVKNSLARFLHTNNQPEVSDFEEAEEDESLISEEDGEPKNTAEIVSDHEKSDDDNKSIKSQKSHSRRRWRVRRAADTEEGGEGSAHSRKRVPRRRVRGDGDDGTVGSVGRRERSRRSARRSGGIDGDPSQRRRRPVGDSHSLDGSELQRRRPVGDSASVDGNTMNRRRRVGDDTDDRSVGSRKSVGRRRRLKGDTRPRRKKSNAKENGKKNAGEATAVQVSDKIDSADVSDEQVLEPEDKPDSIPRRISVQTDSRHCEGLDGSDSSSHFSLIDQPVLIQFDPNNENNFTLVNQSKGYTTSETIRHADGTEYELHITELEGLPTFSAPPLTFDDSIASALSDGPFPAPSTNTLGSTAYEADDDGDDVGGNAAVGETPATNLKSGDVEGDEGLSPRRLGRNKSGGKLRGINSTTSFLQRMRGHKSAPVDNGESQKSFFTGWKKKEKDDSDEEDDAGGFFRKFEAKTHQALEDDGSDHD